MKKKKFSRPFFVHSGGGQETTFCLRVAPHTLKVELFKTNTSSKVLEFYSNGKVHTCTFLYILRQ